MVNRSSEQPNPRKPFQPVKVMSIDGLKRALRYVKGYLMALFAYSNRVRVRVSL
jgi:hypothetical protein